VTNFRKIRKLSKIFSNICHTEINVLKKISQKIFRVIKKSFRYFGATFAMAAAAAPSVQITTTPTKQTSLDQFFSKDVPTIVEQALKEHQVPRGIVAHVAAAVEASQSPKRKPYGALQDSCFLKCR
jgi:hypothetical protein